jgi:hypothetical protein
LDFDHWLLNNFFKKIIFVRAEGFGHEYFSFRRKKNFGISPRGFAYWQNIAPAFSSLHR